MKRIAFIAAVAAMLTGVITMSGSAASFVDSTPCPAEHQFLVCPTGQVGHSYDIQLLARGGCDLYTWEIVNGSLPPGLHMDPSGRVTGSPTGVEEDRPWVWVHDLLPSQGGYSWCIGDNHSERQFVFRVIPGLQIVSGNSIPGGTIGQPYSKQLSVESLASTNPRNASPTTATWSKQSGSLPPGVDFSSSGLLSGTPTAEGSYTFVARADAGGGVDATATYTLNIRQPMTASSPLTKVQKSEVGVPFSVAETATGGSGAFTWSLASGKLPEGIVLNANGSLAGTPSVAGRYTFVVKVADTEGRAVTINATVVVAERLTIAGTQLKTANVGRSYRQRLTKIGGVAPTEWTVLRGKLPSGIKLDTKRGILVGTPKKAGTYRVRVEATDALGVKSSASLKIVVK